MTRSPAPLVTATTARYLFATSWLPCDADEPKVAVPGGRTTALVTGANLLHTALWNLQRQGAIAFEQIRPVQKESVTVLGGRSFVRFQMLMPDARVRGLEGAVLNASRRHAEPDNWLTAKIRRGAQEDEQGLRELIYAMDLHSRAPWATVVGHCFNEAAAAGLVAMKGRLIKKLVIVDAAAIASLQPYADEVRAARRAEMEREPVLHDAIIADCLQALAWAYSTE